MNKQGFILLESLISLAIVSLLMISVMGMIRGTSRFYSESTPSKINETSLKLNQNPSIYRSHSKLSLIKTRDLENGSWHVYEFRGEAGTQKITIFILPETDS